MYEITTEAHFSAAHHLLGYDGPCENVHGHNWLVRATVRCDELDTNGIGMDFRKLKGRLEEILGRLDHTDLNRVFTDRQTNPSSENIARHIFTELKTSLDSPHCRVWKVVVHETPGNSAAYYE